MSFLLAKFQTIDENWTKEAREEVGYKNHREAPRISEILSEQDFMHRRRLADISYLEAAWLLTFPTCLAKSSARPILLSEKTTYV